jgi:hypothetical protein
MFTVPVVGQLADKSPLPLEVAISNNRAFDELLSLLFSKHEINKDNPIISVITAETWRIESSKVLLIFLINPHQVGINIVI